MDPSNNPNAIVPYTGKGGEDLVSEKIDERILRLLGLEDIFDIDYDTYTSLLKEKLVTARLPGKEIVAEEDELIRNEYKRVRGKKGRFKPKKITAESFKRGSAVGINIAKNILPGIVSSKKLTLPEGKTGGELQKIEIELSQIVNILKDQNKEEIKKQEADRKSAETEKRKGREGLLEKGTKLALRTAEKILAPVKSLLSRIIDFITAVFFGRALIKLIDWFSKEENKKKIDAIFRFLGDHWPKLLALFITFGTGIGKFARGLFKVVFQGTRFLVAAGAKLAARAGIKGAAGIAKFALGPKGKLIAGGLELAATVGGAFALSKGIENFSGIEGEDKKSPMPKIPTFSGGGFAHLKRLFGFAGGAYNHLGSGFVSGEKGVDKIPAMLSDGEFVMSRGAVAKYGVDTLEAMNAAGGGTNIPRIVSGVPHAAGGGLIGKAPKLSPLEIKFATRARQKGITDPIELKAFLAQVKHETGGGFGAPKRELYNTSPNDPPGKPGYEYFRGYTGMNGNRNADDAYKYIGRGYLQITGRANYADIGNRIGKDLVNNPQLLMNSDVALDASIEYWKSRVRPNVKNWNNVFEVSRAINKPAALSPSEIMGMQDRTQAFQSYSMIPNKPLMSATKTKPKSIQATPKREPSFIERLGSFFVPQAFAGEKPQTTPRLQANVQKVNIGGRYNVSPPNKSKIKVVYTTPGNKGTKPIVPSGGGKPSLPQFSASHPTGHSRTAKIYGIK